jgi:methylmalonyl-CoA mutase N-terminal domain/subunit
MLRFHTQTAGSMLTAQQPYNNIVRVAVQALAAVLGGTQSLHTNSFDEALALPSEQSVEIALRTQQIIAHESGAADVIDPLGGAWLVEELTDKLEAEATAYISKIDDMGGMVAAIERGYPQAEIQRGAYEWQQSVERDERVIVGVNKFTTESDVRPELERDDTAETSQLKMLEQYREKRRREHPGKPWQAELERLMQMADSSASGGYCEQVMVALKAGATEGEIIKALEQVWGRYRPGV